MNEIKSKQNINLIKSKKIEEKTKIETDLKELQHYIFDEFNKDNLMLTELKKKQITTEKESLQEFISRRRELFLLQYSIDNKAAEIKNLDEILAEEERKLSTAELCLEQDAALFDEFLKESDRKAIEAVTRAELKSQMRFTKESELKQVQSQLSHVLAEITRIEESAKECRDHRDFLESLVPEEIRLDRENCRKMKKEQKMKSRQLAQKLFDEKEKSVLKTQESRRSSSLRTKQPTQRGSAQLLESTPRSSVYQKPFEEEISSDEETSLPNYYTDPRQLLSTIKELEEVNLALIQTCQESEETLEVLQRKLEENRTKIDQDAQVLTSQVDTLRKNIDADEKILTTFGFQLNPIIVGDCKNNGQIAKLEELNANITDVFKECIYSGETSLNSLQMLSALESRIGELLQRLRNFPPHRVVSIRAERASERRARLRGEKKEQQRLHQEERIQKALERATTAPKKHTGRRVMATSRPLKGRRKQICEKKEITFEEEEYLYFFT